MNFILTSLLFTLTILAWDMFARIMLDFFALTTTRRTQQKGPRSCEGVPVSAYIPESPEGLGCDFFDVLPPFINFSHNLPEEK